MKEEALRRRTLESFFTKWSHQSLFLYSSVQFIAVFRVAVSLLIIYFDLLFNIKTTSAAAPEAVFYLPPNTKLYCTYPNNSPPSFKIHYVPLRASKPCSERRRSCLPDSAATTRRSSKFHAPIQRKTRNSLYGKIAAWRKTAEVNKNKGWKNGRKTKYTYD